MSTSDLCLTILGVLGRRSHCSTEQGLLIVHFECATTKQNHAFSVVGPSHWNFWLCRVTGSDILIHRNQTDFESTRHTSALPLRTRRFQLMNISLTMFYQELKNLARNLSEFFSRAYHILAFVV